MKKKICAIYKIEHKESGKFYIGSSVDVSRRMKRHVKDLTEGSHHCIYLQRAWNKYGRKAFRPVIVRKFRSEKLMRKHEQKFLDTLNGEILYNVSKSASGGNLIGLLRGKDYEKLLKRRSKSGREYMQSLSKEERDKKYGRKGNKNFMYGKTHTKEAIAKIVKALTGNEKLIAVRKGKTFEEIYGEDRAKEIRKKLSDSAKVRFVGEGNPFYGKSHTRKVREHLSAINKGTKPTNMRKVKIGKKVYESVTEAGRQLNVCTATICHRIKSPNVKFKDYNYLT